MNRMENKVAIVTGGGSGIGKASAIRLANEGAKISIIEANEVRAKETVEEINQNGGQAAYFIADISQEEQISTSIKQSNDKWRKTDTVFANAGILGTISPIEYFPSKDWVKTIHNNLIGVFETVKHSIPYMKEKGGSITVTSSVSGNRQFAQQGFSAYSTSKAAIAAFAKMAALELAQYKIRVNAICPGITETNIFDSMKQSDKLEEIHFPIDIPQNAVPLKMEPGHPEEVANLLLFLASDEASHVTGTEVFVDGAETLVKG
ncbi:SDR family NAD(P)-dependent oxidoreductase [Niallia sp. 03133]|uniref:SDR family NAD(P)-dependent oxidoreductase n=1 Tax=Niallia sp. 03133 TaxID=3458060 RepID=UPI004043E85B